MLRLQFVLFQADEAAKVLRAGAVPRLRTALLLLDNCTEVLLDRWIEDRLAHEDMRRQIKIRAVEASIPKDHPHFADLFAQTFLTAADASRVARYFNEKLSLKVFDVFAEADAALDRTEYVLDQLALAVDHAIQFEIDRVRGK